LGQNSHGCVIELGLVAQIEADRMLSADQHQYVGLDTPTFGQELLDLIQEILVSAQHDLASIGKNSGKKTHQTMLELQKVDCGQLESSQISVHGLGQSMRFLTHELPSNVSMVIECTMRSYLSD